MVKAAVLLSALPLAGAFVAPSPRLVTRGRSVQMNFGYKEGGRPVGGVQLFPTSAEIWDPIGLSKGKDEEWLWRTQNGEIKNGRVAMLACLDYLVKGLGYRFHFEAGPVNTAEIPGGLASIKALPVLGWWLPWFFLCGFFDILTDSAGKEGDQWWGGYPGEQPWMVEHLPDRVPGNVQPLTSLFNAPGDEEIRTKEINNGRMAMIGIFGIWAGELVTGGQQPLDTLFEKLSS